MSLQTKIYIFQTIALLIVMPIVAFAIHGLEILVRSIWNCIPASHAVDDVQPDLRANLAGAPQSNTLIAEAPDLGEKARSLGGGATDRLKPS
jgi:hypothetical protein